MNYKELLDNSYKVSKEVCDCPPINKLEYLANYIFDFTTYDTEMAILFASKALEVCESINSRTTFDYIKSSNDNYQWYLLLCNIPFFADRIEWGTSIRGAWWTKSKFKSCGIWVGYYQLLDIDFNSDEWEEFISAIIEFAKND